jgi:hypothetical protein
MADFGTQLLGSFRNIGRAMLQLRQQDIQKELREKELKQRDKTLSTNLGLRLMAVDEQAGLSLLRSSGVVSRKQVDELEKAFKVNRTLNQTLQAHQINLSGNLLAAKTLGQLEAATQLVPERFRAIEPAFPGRMSSKLFEAQGGRQKLAGERAKALQPNLQALTTEGGGISVFNQRTGGVREVRAGQQRPKRAVDEIAQAEFNKNFADLPQAQKKEVRKIQQQESIARTKARGVGIAREQREVFLDEPLTEMSRNLTGGATNREAAKKGFAVFGRTDKKSLDKISEFEESATALGDMLSLLDDAKAIAQGRPVTGLVGQAGELVDRLGGNLQNAFRVAGVTPENQRAMLQKMEETVGSLEADDDSVISRMRRAGMDRQVLDSMVFSIAMSTLISRGVRGNRLTATLIDRTIREIGGPTASTETFVKKIDALQKRETNRLANRSSALLGKRLSSKQLLRAVRQPEAVTEPTGSLSNMSDEELERRRQELLRKTQ